MEENSQITVEQFSSWKEDIRKKLQESAENFVYLGYRMKQIRDTKAYEQEGCSSISEWAKKEYGLEKTAVSRFIAINDKFSVDGNSLEMKEQYIEFGSSKLAEMLTLSEEECGLITPSTPVKQIREIKQFNKQEAVEVDEENRDREYPKALVKCVADYFADPEKRKMLNESIKLLKCASSNDEYSKIVSIINPTECVTHKKGIIYLFFYDYETGLKYKTLGSEKVSEITWIMFFEIMLFFYASEEVKNGDYWCNHYGELPVEDKKVEKATKSVKNVNEKSNKKEVSEKPANTSKIESCDVATPSETKEEITENVTEIKEEIPVVEEKVVEPEEIITEESQVEEEERKDEEIIKELRNARGIAKTIVELLNQEDFCISEIGKVQYNIQHLAAVLKRMEEKNE